MLRATRRLAAATLLSYAAEGKAKQFVALQEWTEESIARKGKAESEQNLSDTTVRYFPEWSCLTLPPTAGRRRAAVREEVLNVCAPLIHTLAERINTAGATH